MASVEPSSRHIVRNVQRWHLRIVPMQREEASTAQPGALRTTKSTINVSAYELSLAHEVESLNGRLHLFNATL